MVRAFFLSCVSSTLIVLLVLVSGGCSNSVSLSAGPDFATVAPTATTIVTPTLAPTPSPTPIPTFAAGVRVVGVDIGGLTTEEASKKIYARVPVLNQPLELSAGAGYMTISPDEIDLHLALDDLLTNPVTTTRTTRQTTPTLPVAFDEKALHQKISAFARQTAITPTLGIITDTETISRSFASFPGQAIDVDEAVEQVATCLRSPQASRAITLTMHTQARPEKMPHATLVQIKEQVESIAKEWDGVTGFYLYDMKTGNAVGLNENTVFSGASVMKTAILLYAYANVTEFTEKQQQWLQAMIIESDNLAANYVLAAGAGGTGTEDALSGGLYMSTMLQDLGLEHTYMYMPYEAHDYLVNVRGLRIEEGPAQEGEPPYTEADTVLRTTPAEMSQVFLWLDQCSKGKGKLLAVYSDTLSLDRCQEMLDLLAENGDYRRMRAGMPDNVRVEHKSGWISDMQADVGIVRSPGGDFIVAIYFYKDIDEMYDPEVHPYIAAVARLAYTAYNPINARR